MAGAPTIRTEKRQTTPEQRRPKKMPQATPMTSTWRQRNDEEAEAAHKNEEERKHSGVCRPDGSSQLTLSPTVERKKAALEQLQAIERHFAAFRDR